MELHKGLKLTLTGEDIERLVLAHANDIMREEGYGCDKVSVKRSFNFPEVVIYGESTLEEK